MIERLQAALDAAGGNLDVGVALIDGAGFEGVLIAVDNVGVAISVGSEERYYPWSNIKRIRVA